MNFTAAQTQAINEACHAMRSGRRLFRIGGYAGTGKASHVNAIVYTPFGPKRMGDICVGDQISNPDGGVARVIGVYPQGVRPLYRVTFIDGASTLVTGDHLWQVNLSSKKYKGTARSEVATTDQLRLYMNGNGSRRARPRYPLVPLTKPVRFLSARRRKLFSPYAIGLLIGDGALSAGNCRLSTKDDCLVDTLRALSIRCSKVKGVNCDWHLAKGELRAELRRLGLLGLTSEKKFIPSAYKYADVKDRWELLRGLMDTDGTVGKKGDCTFCSVSPQLAADVQWLVRSLGGKCTISIRESFYRDASGNRIECKDARILYIVIENRKELFGLSRKKDRCSSVFNGGASTLKNRIVSIIPEGKGECQCIQVDNPNSLYITDDFIVTHNTTIMREIATRLGSMGVCAFTGKAASVLRSKGLSDACTMHRLMYEYTEATDTFTRKASLGCQFVGVDEGSMVSGELWSDLRSFGVPTIVIGDPGQLQPIGDDPRLMHEPDIVLEEIHRQAEESTIIKFASHVRHRRAFKRGEKGAVKIDGSRLFWDSIAWADILLCGFNSTRVRANAKAREHRGHKGPICRDERLMVLANNRDLGVFNGMLLTVLDIRKKTSKAWECRCRTDDGEEYDLPIWLGNFGQQKTLNLREENIDRRSIVQADYGYAATVHKAQGSEWGRVAVMVETVKDWDVSRWLYTAATRAAESLRVSIPGNAFNQYEETADASAKQEA